MQFTVCVIAFVGMIWTGIQVHCLIYALYDFLCHYWQQQMEMTQHPEVPLMIRLIVFEFHTCHQLMGRPLQCYLTVRESIAWMRILGRMSGVIDVRQKGDRGVIL